MREDVIQRFLIEDYGVRGQIVRLNQTWQELLSCASYPPLLRQILAQASTASALLGSTLKYNGKLTLQISGKGPVSLINVQMSSDNTLRGLIRWREAVEEPVPLDELCGTGHLTITITTGKGKRDYQGIVSLQGNSIGACIQDYMENSEQVPTQIWFAQSEQAVAGLLLQQLPDIPCPTAVWEEFTALASTIRNPELLATDVRALLSIVFAEYRVRLFSAKPIRFHCNCSQQRIESVLRSLGYEECQAVLREEQCVDVTCEYCNKHYVFSASDIAVLFQEVGQGAPIKPH